MEVSSFEYEENASNQDLAPFYVFYVGKSLLSDTDINCESQSLKCYVIFNILSDIYGISPWFVGRYELYSIFCLIQNTNELDKNHIQP